MIIHWKLTERSCSPNAVLHACPLIYRQYLSIPIRIQFENSKFLKSPTNLFAQSGNFQLKEISLFDLSPGKTCIVNRFGKNIFTENYKLTIGVDFEVQDFTILGHPFKLNVSIPAVFLIYHKLLCI